MEDTAHQDRTEALRAIASMITRSETAKFAQGTAQHTLQRNRVHALRVAAALLQDEQAAFSTAALEQARAPIASLISKSEKARQKLAPGSWQHTMLGENLRALHMAAPLLDRALAARDEGPVRP